MRKKFTVVDSDFTMIIEANREVSIIRILPVTGTPTLRIGITSSGDEIMLDTVVDTYIKVDTDKFFLSGGIIYFTFSGTDGAVNVNVQTEENIF